MATINWGKIKVQVAQDQTGDMQKAARDRADVVFADAVLGLQKDFEESKVTQELDGGIGAKNISETLRGGNAPENLYSFIGFDATENPLPTQAIRDRLDPTHAEGPKLKKGGKEIVNQNARFSFSVNVTPVKEAIYAATPMPWGRTQSWAKKIETGIQGFAQFLPSFKAKNSRSGGGIQVKNELRGGSYVPPTDGYLTTLFNKFAERINDYNRGSTAGRFVASFKSRFKNGG